MSEQRRVFLLITILVGTAFAIGAVSITLLYQTALAEQRARLRETVQSQARLLEAVARFDVEQSTDYPGGAENATLSQIREAHDNYEAFGKTADFTMAEEQNSQIVFLLRHQEDDTEVPQPVPMDSELAEPMRRALQGQSGTMIGLDYRGETVLAAYEPVEIWGWGIVAKIDLSEVQAPFKRAALMSGGVALVMVVLSTLLFLKLTNPLIDNLEESREYFRTTLYSIGDGVMVTDTEGNVQQMNAIAESLTGWAEEDARGKPVTEVFKIVNEETRAEVEDPVSRVLRENRVVGLANHTLLLARGGKENPISDSGAPIQTKAGELHGVVLVFRDQAEERAARRALRESEEKYRHLFENVMNGFALHEIVVNEDGEPVDYVFLEVNRAFEQITGGLKEEDLIGKRVTEVLPGIKDDPTDWIGRFGQVALTGQDTQFVAYSQPLGRWYSVMAFSPRKGQFASIFEDITERKQAEEALQASEQRYRALFNNLPVGVFQSTPAGRYRLVNPAFAHMLGFEEPEEVIDNVKDISALYVNPNDREEVKRLFAQQEELSGYTIRYKHRSGEQRWMSIYARSVGDETGTINYYDGFAVDVTERKRLEAALSREHQQLERLMATGPVAIIMVDPQGQITFANTEAERLLRLDKDKIAQRTYNAPGWQITDFEGNPYPEAALPFVQVKESLQPVRNVQHVIKLSDSERIYLSINAAPLISESGEFEGVVAALDDITALRVAEQELRQSEARLAAFVEAMPDLGFIFNSEGRYIDVTGGQNDLLANDAERLKGSTLHEMLPTDVADKCLEAIRQTLATGETQSVEYELEVQTGHRWFEARIAPKIVPTEADTVVFLARDITERQVAYEEIKRQAAYLRALNQSSQRIGRWGTSDRGVLQAIVASLVEEVGIAFARIWTVDESETYLVLRASAGLYTHLDGDQARIDIQQSAGEIGDVARTSEKLITNRVQEEEGFDWAKEQGLVSFAGYPLVKDRQLRAVLAVFHTEPLPPVALDMLGSFANQAAIALENAALYRELENYSGFLAQAVEERTADLNRTIERVETILHHSPDAILLLTPDGDIEQVNPAFDTILGYGQKEIQTLTLESLVATDMQKSLNRTLCLVQENFQTPRLIVTAQRKDATTFDAEIALAPVTEDNTLLGIVCIIRDISELKELERLKDQFLSTAAHELRTPLVSVQGFSEILLTRELDVERQKRYLTMINEQATQLAHIIDDLLDVSRLEAGRKLDIQKESVIIDELIRDALEPYQETSPRHTILFKPVDEHVKVYTDSFRLTQVIRNLLSNAVKYSPDGGTIAMKSQRLPGYLLVSVTDEGIGMTAREMEHLFEPFWRADDAEKVAGGTGLGLRICQLIIAGHGGGIWAESQVDGGTTFYFTLPLNDIEPDKKA